MSSTVSIAALWRAHREGNQDATRRLLIHYSPLVKWYVGRSETAAFFDLDEMMSLGLAGLWKALEIYTPVKEIPFQEYLRYCIESEIEYWVENYDNQQYAGE